MRMKKVSLTLDEKVVAEAKRRAGPSGLSAYVNDVVKQHLQSRLMLEFMDELDEKYGPVPPEVAAEVDKEWDRAIKRLRKYERG